MQNNQLIFYSTPQSNVKVEVIFEDVTFGSHKKDGRTLWRRSACYQTGQLDKAATISIWETVQQLTPKYQLNLALLQ